MTLRKKTVNNSVRNNPQSEKTNNGNNKPNISKAGSLPRKQKNILHKTIKNSLKT